MELSQKFTFSTKKYRYVAKCPGADFPDIVLKAGGKPSTWFPPGGTRRAGYFTSNYHMETNDFELSPQPHSKQYVNGSRHIQFFSMRSDHPIRSRPIQRYLVMLTQSDLNI